MEHILEQMVHRKYYNFDHIINTGCKLIEKVSSEFIATCVGLVEHGQLFKDPHFIGTLELETNDPPKPSTLQTLDNPINILLTNPNII